MRVNQGLTAGYRAANGELVCLRNDGNVARYDVTGKELKAFPSNRDTSWTSGIDLVRNGNILVTQPSPGQKVTEYTPDGKVVKEWSTPERDDGHQDGEREHPGGQSQRSRGDRTRPDREEGVGVQGRDHIFRAKRR